MKNEILYLLLNEYADHEPAFLGGAISCDERSIKEHPKYINKILAPTLDEVRSCSGFRTLPDYSFESMPEEYAALILIGGYQWQSEEAERVVPIVKRALEKGIVVGAICNGASFLARYGFLNQVKHTGNGLEQLKLWGGENYTNASGYVNRQAVRDGRVVTANGSGYLEFAKELLLLLESDAPEHIELFYRFQKEGFVKMCCPPKISFNTVGLFTKDLTKMVTFYREVWEFETDWNGVDPDVEMRLGDMRLILYPREAFEAMTSRRYSYPDGLNGTLEISFDVPSYAAVDAEYARAVGAGATPVFPPKTEPWGQRTCYMADPDGNLIELSSFVK